MNSTENSILKHIWNKYLIIFIICLQFSINMNAQSCLPNDITLSNQTEVDTFLSAYPSCKQIKGTITITSLPDKNSITNLNSFSGLISIDGAIIIRNCPGLINISGLDSLISIGIDSGQNGYIYGLNIFRCGLNSVDGLNKLKSIKGDLTIENNNFITDINGFNSLVKVKGRFSIGGNPLLTNITGFSILPGTGEDSTSCYFQLWSNDKLSNIDGFSSLKRIEGDFLLVDNSLLNSLTAFDSLKFLNNGDITIIGSNILTSLDGIGNIDYSSISSLFIEACEKLNFCSVPSICNFLNNTNKPNTFNINATGCNSKEEVLASCCTLELSILEKGPYLIAQLNAGFPPFIYLWSTGETTDIIIKNTGNYCVTVTDSNGCSNILCQTVGTNNIIDNQDGFIIYPNPVSSLLSIELNNKIRHEKSFKLAVYQPSGKEIYRGDIPAFAYIHNVDVSVWPAGMYYFSVTDDRCRGFNGKFIVVR
ncbi:MAG TPA: T9SS type A sorting domain-containing protein [Saprospiraceae bacterium]|nr:T9SS type A sorting domain-containing protein [Saprospiraceae bacterium]